LRKTRLLLVDDSKLQQIVTGRALSRAGYDVISAQDGEEAIRLTREQHPDLILLDMLLPKLSGPQVIRNLKQDPSTAAIPIIVLSGLSQANEEKLKSEGATAYFEKSRFESDTKCEGLIDAVELALRDRSELKTVPAGRAGS
jgi:CheY-like chemotaxis protein